MKHLLALLLWASAWLWFYKPSLTGLASLWRTGDLAYGWAVPLLAAGLGLIRWRKSPGAGCDPAPAPGYVCLALALGMALLGRAGDMDSLGLWSLWASVLAVVLLTGGLNALWNQALALAVLLFCLPLPLPLRLEAGRISAALTAELAARLLHISGTPAFQDGAMLDLGFLRMNVALACDGVRFMLPAMLVALLAGTWLTRGFWPRLILVAAAPGLAVLANGLRLGLAGYLARHSSLLAAQSFYHEVSGYGAFGLVLAGLLGLVLVFRLSAGRSGAADLDRVGGAALFGPLSPPLNRNSVLHVLVAAAVLAACVPAFPKILNVRGQFAREEFAAFPSSLGKWEQDAEASARGQGLAWAGDDTLSRIYRSGNRPERVGLRIAYRRVQRPPYHIREALVPPAGEGWVLTGQAALPPSEEAGRDFPVWRGVFERKGERVLAYVWLRGRGRAQAVSWRGRLALAWDTLFTRRADGALLRLDLPLPPGMTLAEGEKVLDGFCQGFKDILPAYVPEP